MHTSGLRLAVFPTAVGPCGIVWDAAGAVHGTSLPQGGSPAVRRALLARFPGADEAPAPPGVAATVAELQRLLAHGEGDLSGVVLDMTDVPAFDRRTYEIVRTVPPGHTLTYGEVADRLGAPGAAQAVGRAMGRNPFPPIVPCHRVLAADGGLGGFSARGGAHTKRRMLETEGALPEQAALFDL